MADACKIIQHLGSAKYEVELLYDATQYNDRIEELDKFLKDQDNLDKLNTLEQDVDDIRLDIINGLDTLNLEIANLRALLGTDEYEDQVKLVIKHTGEGLKRKEDFDIARESYISFFDIMESKRLEKKTLVNKGLLKGDRVNIWCVDLSDGEEGRAIYADDELAPIWCINYDPGKLVLPPKNITVETIGNDGALNAMWNFPEAVAPASAFVNVALEPGFARWKPIFLEAKALFNSLDDCRVSVLVDKVEFDGLLSRAGHPLLKGIYPIDKYNYFQPKAFFKGDDVVCKVEFPVTDPKSDDYLKPSIELVGFLHDPKKAPDTTLLGHDRITPSSTVDTVTPIPTGGSARSTVIIGGYLIPGKAGKTTAVIKGYTIEGANNSISTRNDVTVTYIYETVSPPPGSEGFPWVYLTKIEYSPIIYNMSAINPRGEKLYFNSTTTNFTALKRWFDEESFPFVFASSSGSSEQLYETERRSDGSSGFREEVANSTSVSERITETESKKRGSSHAVIHTVLSSANGSCGVSSHIQPQPLTYVVGGGASESFAAPKFFIREITLSVDTGDTMF